MPNVQTRGADSVLQQQEPRPRRFVGKELRRRQFLRRRPMSQTTRWTSRRCRTKPPTASSPSSLPLRPVLPSPTLLPTRTWSRHASKPLRHRSPSRSRPRPRCNGPSRLPEECEYLLPLPTLHSIPTDPLQAPEINSLPAAVFSHEEQLNQLGTPQVSRGSRLSAVPFWVRGRLFCIHHGRFLG